MQNIYHIPYSGNIEKIDANKVSVYAAKEEGKAAEAYHVQQDRIAAANLDVTVLAPAQAGGLLVRCAAKEVQGVYDAVFGHSYVAPKNIRSAIAAVEPQAEQREPSSLSFAFGYAAKRFHVSEMFSKAAAAPVADNNNFAPQLIAA